ncbi:restriction endonuclease subunit S [Paraburkholderia sediminicola]|uniref:restriction endonuclease subunit S n=1 Tax=Paraburkholderia sediminicola TaxID=458836 RepID=UPI0038BC0B93
MNLVAEPSSPQSPTGWEMKSIGDVFNVVERAVKMDSEQQYRRVTVKRRHGGIELRDIQRGADIKVKSQFLIKAGDFLISERQVVHGACGIVPPELEGALVSNEYLVLEARKSFDANYFNYLVQLQKYAKLFLLCSQGVDIEKFLFKPQDWLKKEIPVPPFFEQQKIAAILTSADEKLDVIGRQVEATRILKRGLMQTLFSRGVGSQEADGRWVPHAEFKDSELGEIPAGWGVATLDSLSESITVGIATSTTEYYVDDGVPLVRNQNIREDFLDMTDLLKISREFDEKNRSKRVREGDILTVRTGYPGVSCVVPGGLGRLQSFTTLITRPSRELINPYFVSHYFNSPKGKELMLHQAAGGAQQNINAGNLRKLLVPVPSLAEQQRLVEILQVVDNKYRSLMSKKERYQELKRGLMQKLLTGEWRVKLEVTEPVAA